MSNIFISHSSKDLAEVVRLKEWLDGQGFSSIFLDFDTETGIAPGADWERTIYREIDRAAAVLLVLTPSWLASKWCFAEFTQARALGKAIYPLIESPDGDLIVSPDIQHLDLVKDREGGLNRLARDLNALILNSQGGFEWDQTRSPFPGLSAMEEADAAVYFGRDDDIRRLIERLNARRSQGGEKIVTLLGASGSGKSSLIRAGVLPRLSRDKTRWILLPPFRPRTRPIDEFAQTLASVSGEDWRAWLQRLETEDATRALLNLARDLRMARGANEATILLTIDQGEELFSISETAQSHKMLELIQAMSADIMPFVTMIGLRSDYLPQWQAAESLTSSRFEQVSLKPMPVERIRQIIEGPARVAGLAADEGLIMAAARDAAVDDALPLLAFALRELSDGRGSSSRLALADYQALGDMKENLSPLENAVRRRADATLARRRATDEDLAALKDALVPAAVRVNLEGEYVRRPALFDEMPARARPMIEALVDARLLTSSADDGVRQVEVVHEALLRKWPLLRGWLDEEREFIIGREQLRHDVADWRNASGKAKMGALLTGLKLSKARIWLTDHARHIDKEEQSFIQASIREADSQVRRRRFLMRAAVTAAVVATMFAGLAGWQWNVADKATVLALNSEQEALAQKRIADNQASLATERGTEAERQRDASQRSAAEAVAQQRIAEANQAAALTSLAETRLSNNPAEAIKLALAAWPRDEIDPLKRSLSTFSILQRGVSQQFARRVLAGHTRAVLDIEFSPDQKQLLTVSEDGTARTWDVASGESVRVLDPKAGPLSRAHYSPDGALIVTAGNDRAAWIWDSRTGIAVGKLEGHTDSLTDAQFSPDGQRILTTSSDNTARLWNAVTRSLIATLTGHKDIVHGGFSRDGERIVTVSGGLLDNNDPAVAIWDGRTGMNLTFSNRQPGGVKGVAFSPDGVTFATYMGAADPSAEDRANSVRIWSLRDGRLRAQLVGHGKPVEDVAFSPNGKIVATSALDGAVRLWNANSGALLGTLKHTAGEKGIGLGRASFSPGGSRLISVATDGSIKVWETTTGKLIANLKGHRAAVEKAIYAMPPDRIVSVSADKTAIFWDATSFSAKLIFGGGQVRFNAGEFSADGSKIILAGGNGSGIIDDLSSGSVSETTPGKFTVSDARLTSSGDRLITRDAHHHVTIWTVPELKRVRDLDDVFTLSSLAISKSGKLLAADLVDNDEFHVGFVDLDSGKTLRVISETSNPTAAIAFSPNADVLARASIEGELGIWRVSDGALIAKLVGHREGILDIAFSHDGKRLVTASVDATARVWDVTTGKQLFVLRGHSSPVRNVEFSPNDRLILAAANQLRLYDALTGEQKVVIDNTGSPAHFSPSGRFIAGHPESPGAISIFDVETGTSIVTILAHEGEVTSASFSPDGKSLLTTGEDGYARIWSLEGVPERSILGIACAQLADRNFQTLASSIALGAVEPSCTGAEPLPNGADLIAAVDAKRDGITSARVALFSGKFADAIEYARAALLYGDEKDKTLAGLVTAHALMLMGRTDEAREAYLARQGKLIRYFLNMRNGDVKSVGSNTVDSWERTALDDFAELRAAGLQRPLMDEIGGAFSKTLARYEDAVNSFREADEKYFAHDYVTALPMYELALTALEKRSGDLSNQDKYAQLKFMIIMAMGECAKKKKDMSMAVKYYELASYLIESKVKESKNDEIWQYDLIAAQFFLSTVVADSSAPLLRAETAVKNLVYHTEGSVVDLTQYYPKILAALDKLVTDRARSFYDKRQYIDALEIFKEDVGRARFAAQYGFIGKHNLSSVLNLEAWYAIFARDFELTRSDSERAIALVETDEQRFGPMTNRAHALMLLDRITEARDAYMAGRGLTSSEKETWEHAILSDFVKFRAAGISHPLMGEIEKAFKKR